MKRKIHQLKIGAMAAMIAVFASSCEKEKPVALFDYSPSTGSAPLNVNFTNQSTNATAYYWDFGDGTTSSEVNPRHKYIYGGSFTITLTASNGNNKSTISKSIYVRNPESPVANFSFNPSSGNAPCEVTFYNYSTNATSYFWDFGNGKTSTLTSPTVVYNSAGTYLINLTATNNNGQTNKMTKSIVISAKPTKIQVNSLVLTTYPEVNSSGSSWDISSGPDIYFNLTDDAGNDFGKTGVFSDVLKSELPLTFKDFTTTINNLDYRFIIEMHDYDDFDADDYMGGYYFTPSDWAPSSGTNYPTQLKFYNASLGIGFTLNVTWL